LLLHFESPPPRPRAPRASDATPKKPRFVGDGPDPEGPKVDPEGPKVDAEGPKVDAEGCKVDPEGFDIAPDASGSDTEASRWSRRLARR